LKPAGWRRLVRLPLALLPAEADLPILRGPARGCRWIVGSAPHGAWLGSLERDKLARFAASLRPSSTVWDIGANVGLFTLPAALGVGPQGQVVAFEPFPANLDFLDRHVALNRLSNVTVVRAAVGAETGWLTMSEGSSRSEFHADPDGTWQLPAVRLDGWRSASGTEAPAVVKIDVEGAEADVLAGGAETFATFHPTVFLALHSEAAREACGGLLSNWGYRIASLDHEPPERSVEWLAEYDPPHR
jgi:FkbM family methyltransferase